MSRASSFFIVIHCPTVKWITLQNPSGCDNTETMKRKNVHAVALGKLGGRVKSEAKTRAARENGLLGGRPRKPGPEEEIERTVREIATATRLSEKEIEQMVREGGSATAGLSEDKIEGVIRFLRRRKWTADSLRSWIDRAFKDFREETQL